MIRAPRLRVSEFALCSTGLTGREGLKKAGVGREERERRVRKERETEMEGEYGRDGRGKKEKRVREEGRGTEGE